MTLNFSFSVEHAAIFDLESPSSPSSGHNSRLSAASLNPRIFHLAVTHNSIILTGGRAARMAVEAVEGDGSAVRSNQCPACRASKVRVADGRTLRSLFGSAATAGGTRRRAAPQRPRVPRVSADARARVQSLRVYAYVFRVRI